MKSRTRSAAVSDRVRPQASPARDPVVDPGPGAGATGPVVSFDGFSGDSSAYRPPDAVGAVGRTHFVEITNSGYAIYTRKGSLAKSGRLGELWQGLEPCTSNDQGDPTIVYDEPLGRWVLSMFAFKGNPDQTPSTTQCVAISPARIRCPSRRGGPGSSTGAKASMSYPKLGVWPSTYLYGNRAQTRFALARGHHGSGGNGSGRHRAE